MTDFELFDVTSTCKLCGVEFQTKAFVKDLDTPRVGLCDDCYQADVKRMDGLTKHHPRAGQSRKPDVPDYRQRAAGDT